MNGTVGTQAIMVMVVVPQEGAESASLRLHASHRFPILHVQLGISKFDLDY